MSQNIAVEMVGAVCLPVLADNYTYLLCQGREAAVLDPGESDLVLNYLKTNNLNLTAIFATHDHGDHIDGIKALSSHYGCPIYGAEESDIPGLTHPLSEGVTTTWRGQTIQTLFTPGHSRHDISLHLPGPGWLFPGDILFNAGCGRPLHSEFGALWSSLQRLSTLPGSTLVYCGHEYTLDNLRFALSILPDDPDFRAAETEARRLREAGQPTVPFCLADQRRSNIFLRAGDAEVKRALGLPLASDQDVFRELRSRKNRFA